MWVWLDKIAATVFVKVIQVYQQTISLDHGLLKFLKPYGQCRFKPTCSEYGIEALQKYGFLKGGAKLARRLLKCNPFNSGGYDPLK